MPILNYTTTISALKTAAEVQTMLAKHGASSVSLVYDGGTPLGIAFTIETTHGMRDFQLPVNAAGVELTLKKQRVATRFQGSEQAHRVAWRIVKDWVAAQLAIIEAGMSSLDEVMLPYMVTAGGVTLSQAYQQSVGFRAAIEGAQ
jgi:hypothetical protein